MSQQKKETQYVPFPLKLILPHMPACGGRFPRVFGDTFGEEFGDKFGDEFSESPNLVMN